MHEHSDKPRIHAIFLKIKRKNDCNCPSKDSSRGHPFQYYYNLSMLTHGASIVKNSIHG